MPIPNPKSNENESEFVSRCVKFLADEDKVKDNKQRIAICYTTYSDNKKKKSIKEKMLKFKEINE